MRVKRWAFLLPLFLFLPLLLLAGRNPAPSPTEPGGLGGAFGATSYSLPASATATPAPTTTPTVKPPKMYGGSGKNGACLGTSGAGNDMIKMDFGWSASFLNKKWRDYPSYRLCNDHYTWETVTVLPVQKVFQTLQWPSDLLIPQYANQVVTLQPLSTFDPVTQQAQQQANGQPTEKNKNCLWHVSFAFINGDLDICQPIRLLVGAVSSGIHAIYQSTTAQIDFLWQTPLKPFQDDKTSGLLTIWSTSWAIVLACVTAVLVYGALRYMLGSAVNWLAYANLTELIPRLLFGLLAAYFSKEFFIMLIQGNNALASIFNHGSLDMVMNGKVSGVVDESLQIVYGVMGFLLIIEEAARMAIIYLLFAFAPILFFFASLRETQRWARTAATAAIIFVFLQAIQSATLDVGGHVLATVLHNTDGQLSFLNLLISLTILYVTLMLFFSLARMALGVGGGPLGVGVLGASVLARRSIPMAANAIGAAAAAYRHTRSHLFPLPPRYPPALGTSSSGQTPVTVGAKPFVGRGNGQGPGGPAGPGGTQNSGPNGKMPGGPAGKKPGGGGSGGAQTASPAAARPPLNVQGKTGGTAPSGAATPGVSRPSAVQQSGSAPASQSGQWQKTPPPQQQRRRMAEQKLMNWLFGPGKH